MQLKYTQTILEAQDNESKIVSMCWSANNLKLAVATADRQILLFDEKGEKRDRFSTKPFDPEAGKKSYIIQSIAFSPDSAKIAVGQSDCIVYVYKIGEKWGDKKAISNKFPQPAPVTALIWLSTGPIICGLTDGKVRAMQIKSNKCQSLYAADSLVVSLASNVKGNGFLSGHVDGNVIRFFLTSDYGDEEAQGRVVLHPVPPVALTWPQGHIIAAGCDKRVCVYSSPTGKLVRSFDYTKDAGEHDFTAATSSPSGQAVVIGSFDRLRMYIWNTRKSLWEETPAKDIKNIYTITSLAWKRDGSRVSCGGLCGAVLLFESVLRRTVWKDKYEITYVGPSQVLIKPIDSNEAGVVIRSQHGGEIDDVKIMGHDNYLIARTGETLIVADLLRNLMSEVPWNHSGKHERFYLDYPTVCLVFNAGELSLIEYGTSEVLCSVRTEFANPHLLSVRLNERSQDCKKLAYLLDLKTICIHDLVTGHTVAQLAHDSKVDWLELSETGHKLLFRDKKQRLLLVDTASQVKQCILTGVSFAQWVEQSDVAVAQAGTTLAVWYNVELPESPTMLTVRGDVTDVVRQGGKTEALCVDANGQVNSMELDEGLVEFGTAVHDNDYARAVLFLESLQSSPEAEAMWHSLLSICLRQHDLKLAGRCEAALGNAAAAHYLAETEEAGRLWASEHPGEMSGNCPEVWARLAILSGDLTTAESVYVEQGDLEKAVEMYKTVYKWEEALRLAEQRGYEELSKLKEEHMSMLTRTGQLDKVGEMLEKEGNPEQALEMYMKSGRLLRIPNLLFQHPELLEDHSLMAGVLKSLLKQDHFEAAASVYEKLDKPELAMECYRKGKVWNKAVDVARAVNPEQVVVLEEEWGDSLVEAKQMDAAISHYIEAGCTLKALDAAVAAAQWKKAVHIVKVIDEPDTVAKYYRLIADHFATVKEYGVAERLYVQCGMHREAVEMYNAAGQWEKAHALAARHLDSRDVERMYVEQAGRLEEAGKYREAERLYLSVTMPDMAIAMYKRAEQYDNMIRLVERHHPDLVHTTHQHLGQQLESQGRYRQAEVHYLAAGDWKAAAGMYRTTGNWEEAYRVARQHGGSGAALQVAYLWARTLPVDSALRLLAKYGLLEQCVEFAAETGEFGFAFQLSKNMPEEKVKEVHYKHAIALEDEGKLQEAEAEFVSAGRPKEAVLMYVHAHQWMQALRVAETHEPAAVPEVLQAQAAQSFHDKEYSEFEVLLLRAQMPELIVQKYKSSEMWVDALRVCKDYLPHLYPGLQAEYSATHRSPGAEASVEALLSKANEWALAGQHRQAIDCLLQVTEAVAEPSIVRRALLRAGDMVNRFLYGAEAVDVVRVLAPRLSEVGEHNAAAQLYVSLDMMKEAIDTFVAAEDWAKARKVAKELEPAYESYVESKYKDRLLRKGDVEQLADVDLIGALDLLAQQGQWARCIEKARQSSAPVLHKYVALYAARLLKDGLVIEALDLYSAHGAPAMPQNFNIYNHIAAESFAAPDLGEAEAYPTWEKLRQMLYEINEGLESLAGVSVETKGHFKTLLLIAHYYALRCACRQVPSLKSIGVKISTSLLRYSDIIPADKAYYEAGKDLKDDGKLPEAFVFLNHYLDLCEAIEEGEGALVDHSDLVQTDYPSNVPLPSRLYLAEDSIEHDSIREWVLAVSMDQRVDQTLPLDDRQLFESSLSPGENPCLVTGYPVRKQTITFGKPGFQANRDAWSKLVMGGKMAPDSNVPSVIAYLNKWCGPPAN